MALQKLPKSYKIWAKWKNFTKSGHTVLAKTGFKEISACDRVDRAVTSKTRGPGFESSHRQFLSKFYLQLTFTVQKLRK